MSTWMDRGGIYLGGVQFNTDPDPYKPFEWDKRVSEHMTIKNPGELRGLVIQDFGMTPRDNQIILGSGRERLMSEDIVTQLYMRLRQLGATHFFEDWLGNQFMVFMKEFKAVPFKRGGDGQGGVISLYTYDMKLRVYGFVQTFGRADSGSGSA